MRWASIFVKCAIAIVALRSPRVIADELKFNAAVLETVKTIPDKGGYNKEFRGSGTPKEIRFGDQTILPKGRDGTYCSGITFTVLMDVAAKQELLKGKTAAEVKELQRIWYGTTEKSKEKQCVLALEELKIGSEIDHDGARQGDFVQFWRTKSGHSAVFLEWVIESDRRIGLRYRSSQGSTDGVGDNVEYFSDVLGKKGAVDRKRTYFGRLGT